MIKHTNERMIMKKTLIATAALSVGLILGFAPDANAKGTDEDPRPCGDTVRVIMNCDTPTKGDTPPHTGANCKCIVPPPPACRNEDGSGQRRTCIWDGRHMGNGVGRSYKAITRPGQDDRIKYISHRRAHFLLSL